MPMLARLSGLDSQHGRASLNALQIKVCQGGDKLPQHSSTHYMPAVGIEPLSSPSQFSFAEAEKFHEAQEFAKGFAVFRKVHSEIFLLLTFLWLTMSREMTTSGRVQQASVLHHPQYKDLFFCHTVTTCENSKSTSLTPLSCCLNNGSSTKWNECMTDYMFLARCLT